MKQNQRLRIQLTTSSGQPLKISGVVITVSFFLNGKYRYAFRSTPSNSHGVVMLTYDDLETSRRRNLKIQPLDYKTPLESCDDEIRISLPSGEELLRAADTLEKMGENNYPDQVAEWRGASNGNLSSEDLSLTVARSEDTYELMCTGEPRSTQ